MAIDMLDTEYNQCLNEICDILMKYKSTKYQIDRIITHLKMRTDSSSSHSALNLDSKFDPYKICDISSYELQIKDNRNL